MVVQKCPFSRVYWLCMRVSLPFCLPLPSIQLIHIVSTICFFSSHLWVQNWVSKIPPLDRRFYMKIILLIQHHSHPLMFPLLMCVCGM
jgi:hypothetical protein